MESVGVVIILFMLLLLLVVGCAVIYQLMKIVEEDREFRKFMCEIKEYEH